MMAEGSGRRLLTVNTGSSSLKVALYEVEHGPAETLSAQVDRIGSSGGRTRVEDESGRVVLDRGDNLPDHAAALRTLLAWMRENDRLGGLYAAGHRIVHGGPYYSHPVPIDDEVIARLRTLIPIDPEHLPQAIAAVEVIAEIYPNLPQVACFDTAFHRTMPAVAQMYPLPPQFADQGVIRYGFHGLSYEYIMRTLGGLDPPAVDGRVIIAHLGNGASMAGVRDGKSVDTTMGFSPTGGLVMGTRTGDLDPSVVLFLLQGLHMDPTAVSVLLNKQSGLLGVSGVSEDMRDLLAREADDRRAAQAVELFCYQARKLLAGLAAVLDGVDTLIFTGGIGEHGAPIRERICMPLGFMGIRIDPARNGENAPVISPAGSPVTVRVMETDEDLMIAEHTARLVRK